MVKKFKHAIKGLYDAPFNMSAGNKALFDAEIKEELNHEKRRTGFKRMW